MHQTGHREKKEAEMPRRERKNRRKEKKELQTGHGEKKEAEVPRRE